MYQVRPDRVGESVLAALAAAGRRGVRVRLLVDTFGSLPAARHIAQLANTPACVRWYNPFLPGHRTHRKLVVVDGQRACLGGMNLGEEFSESSAGRNCWREAAMASEQLNSLTWRDHPDRLPVVEALALALANIV